MPMDSSKKFITLENLERFKANLENTFGKPEGLAPLDNDGLIPSQLIPASAFSVVEYSSIQNFPETGETGKIYIESSTKTCYLWDDTNSEYVSTSSPETLKYTEQTLTAEEQAQARQNIGAISAADVPEGNNVRYVSQQLTEEQKAQARQNIDALGTSEMPQLPENILTYAAQNLTSEQKIQARANINAASDTEVDGLSDTVSSLNSRLNNFGNFVRAVNETEDGIEVVYDNNQTVPIQTGLVFNGGFVDENNYLHLKLGDTTLSDDVFTPVQLPAGGGGGGGGATLSLTNVVKTNNARNGAPAVFSFVATSADDTDITVKWYVNDALYATQIKDSGASFSFDAAEYLTPSAESTVKVLIESASGASLSRRWTVKTVAFAINFGNAINNIMLYTTNSNIYVPINVSAEANSNNVVSVTVGENEPILKPVTGSMTVTFELNKNMFESGVNVINATMFAAEDHTDKVDKDIHFTAIWGYGTNTPVVAFADEEVECNQYDMLNLNYFVFDPNNELADCTIEVEGENPRDLTVGRTIQTFQYSPLYEGTTTITLSCDQAETSIDVVAARSPYILNYFSDDSLLYNLDPVGHSNADADREQFAGLTFSQNFDWENGGFKNDSDGAIAFVVKKGNYVTLPRSVFADNDANGKTIDLSFKVTNSDQYDAVAIQDLNDGGDRGIVLYANNGEIYLNNVTGQEFRYCEESRIDLSILVESLTAQRVATVWLDGLPSKVTEYEPGMLTHNENPMTIGSEHCDVWVYAIRCYNSELSKKQMVQNYVSEGSTTPIKVDRYQKNTIFDEYDRITPSALHAVVPNLTLVQIETSRMTVSKKDPVPAKVTITDGATVLELDAASASDAKDGTLFKVQGTSSAAYGRSSYNLDIDFKGTGKKYKLSENAIPVNYIMIKVNVASSENANNINGVDWYNMFQPYITEPRNRPGVRDTCEGKPCAVFIKNTSDSSVWFSSQLVGPGETILYAMGDICNSKKNTAVFGQDGKTDDYVEHPTKACLEVSGNDTDPQRFRSTAATFDEDEEGWVTTAIVDGKEKKIMHYEWRMAPDGTYDDTDSDMHEVVDSWNALVTWVVSTIGNSAKFKREVGNYFAIKSLLYHFLFIEYFAAYDNVSKNTFYSYDWDEDAQKYLWNIKAAYDMDTILACDNDGKPFGDYGLDYNSTANGRSYFNAVDNPIWVNIQEAFYDELSTLYNTLRTAGAWNSNEIANKWDSYQAKRPHAAMIADAYIKYIYPYKTSGMTIDNEVKGYDDSYLPRLQGSKTYWRKQFLTYQTAYMDGKYGYYSKTNSMQFRTNCASGERSFAIKSYATTYVTFIVDDNRLGSRKVEAGQEVTFTNVSVGTNTTLYITPDRLIQYVRPLNETDNSTFTAPGASKLMEAILGGENVNNSWPAGTGVNVPSVLLKELSIRNMPNFSNALNLSPNVELESVDTRGTSAGMITLPSFAPLTSIQLNACTGIAAYNLKKAEVFTMESGTNLVSVRMENCNALINNALATYLTQATASTQNSTRRIRALDVDWTFSNLDVIYKIATTWKGYNALGEEQDTPVVTGVIHVSSISSKKLELIHSIWGSGNFEDALDEENRMWTSDNLTITYDSYIPYYIVSFKNIDGSWIKDKKGNNYAQYIDVNQYAYDPITAGEVDTPTYIDPNGQYNYTFTEWTNLSGKIVSNRTVTASYTQSTITYTVRWWDKPNGTIWDTRENIPYGSEAIYDPQGTIGLPVYEDQEVANIYNVFTGWDKSTGFITENMDVYARWDTAVLPEPGDKNLKDMRVSEIYGITKTGRADEFFSDEDYTDIVVGKDFDFSNVESEVILNERYFNGNEVYRRNDLKLFSEDAPSFTLAVDYEFCDAVENHTLISCCDDTGNIEGFRIYFHTEQSNTTQNHSIKIIWGGQSTVLSHGFNRGIIVLRHKKGSKNLLVASSNEGKRWGNVQYGSSWGLEPYSANYYNLGTGQRYDGYNDSIVFTELPREQETISDCVLSFGAMAYGSAGFSDPTKGWIHWAKIWYDDLGANNVKQLASWPRETWRMHYRGRGLYNRNDGTGLLDNATFIANAPLSEYYDYYQGQSNTAGSWEQSELRTFLNDRVFKAMPYSWQTLIKPVRVITNGGADNISALQYTTDKIFIPARADMTNITSGQIAQEGRQISWFTNNASRVKFMGINIPEDAQIITTPTDPTLYTETYTVKEGDVWINSNSTANAFVYVSSQTAESHAQLGGRFTVDTNNNIIAQGPQGGLWVRSTSYWTRTVNTSSSYESYQYVIYRSGSVDYSYIGSEGYRRRAVVIMFSI